MFYLSSNPGILQRLRKELTAVIPNPFVVSRWSDLEQLPYFSAVISEGIRLAYSLTTRLPRIAHEPLTYRDWEIPPGTPTSETIYFVLTDEALFPQPDQFRPERWLEQPELSRYLVAFGRDTRMCLGIKSVVNTLDT